MLNHYQTLNVSSTADLAAIKRAYHKISLSYHPDKTVHLPSSDRAEREHLFKLANVAFEVLSDPHKRKLYDHNLAVAKDQAKEKGSDTNARPANHREKADARSRNGEWTASSPQQSRASSPPPRSPPSRASDTQGSHGVHRAPRSTHRFSASTLGKPPDFNWYHCNLNEQNDRTTLNYNNWLGWRVSIDIENHFRVVAKPTFPENPVSESILIRLPLRRKVRETARALTDVVVDVRGTPGSKHTILSSELIETPHSLDLLVEVTIASEDVQKDVSGPALWKWAYRIDHEPLSPDRIVKVTSLMFYPSKPFMALSPTGRMPTMPYPAGSPMYGLWIRFPGIQIDESAPVSYCMKEEQQGKTIWRLTAFGAK